MAYFVLARQNNYRLSIDSSKMPYRIDLVRLFFENFRGYFTCNCHFDPFVFVILNEVKNLFYPWLVLAGSILQIEPKIFIQPNSKKVASALN